MVKELIKKKEWIYRWDKILMKEIKNERINILIRLKVKYRIKFKNKDVAKFKAHPKIITKIYKTKG